MAASANDYGGVAAVERPWLPPLFSCQQKPDLVLLDRSYYDKLSKNEIADTVWAFVKAIAEVHQPNAQLTEMTSRSYLTFLCQPHRRFTISLSFFKAKKI